ncbi:MAG: hypothetical protein A3D74_02405 [Candidatus Levybacteria bacterium RIFCSPHIGHO2_02_FULL_37_13]|nr:MAG: hypothetical protein A3D74_02405 [Candidatus Levybacteria bacterium RIFCSPHIGHO2_02_FULL_37_13]OGH29580.1 MAG: hypothetical protein A3E40_04810 [Candidatus Levybacteria bacterium RIFCSPHIGHO2_12_FULL_37_9]OGH39898.1 MAG: hypothetical protein A3B41_02415 [Candidatus Levybacteria bacterium RIFCSPLOWO2_01_FULL_37_26]
MTNLEIAKLLRNVAASYEIKDENKFRFQIIAYKKAADAIQNSSSEVKDLFKEKKLSSLPGVGPSISSHLEELLKTGKVKHFEWVMQGIPKTVFPLLDVPTVGPKKAFRLTTELSLKNPETAVNDLKIAAVQGKIAKIEGFGEKSQADILRAISDFFLGKGKTTRMALPYAFEIAEKLVSYLKTHPSVIQAIQLGSLRRMMPTVGDIDIAVATSDPKSAIMHFINYPYKERIIEQGQESASILLSNGKQIDLMTQPPKKFGALLQHFTGSKNHNIKLREYALSKRLSLSEHGIKKEIANDEWKMKNYSKEEDFYKALGMDWIPPELREDTGEVELAIKHKLPKLVELPDVKGDLHIHSNFPIDPSHDLGKNSMKEMVARAEELKYEYLGFSEHNPSISKHTKGEIYNLISRRNAHIEQIKSHIKNVRIIKLLEIDILVNGSLAVDNKSLELLDGAIVSIHSSFGMNKESMTKRVLQGLSHPKAKILAHPTGRMLNQRPGYDLNFEKIFDFCKKYKKALEINSWPERLDLPDSIIKQAVQNEVKLIINTDSHSVSEMNLMRYGVAMARRGWAKKSDILNTLGYNEFIKWLKGGEL